MINFLKPRKSNDKNRILPASEDDRRKKRWSPSKGSWLDYKDTWWKRRSMVQKYLLFLTGFTGAFIITGIIEYRAPDLAVYLLPESYRDFLHTDMYNGSISPGLLIFVIGAVWFPLTPLLYGAIRRYRAQKRLLQSQQQSHAYWYGGKKYVTRKGEVVKSYGEKKIADYLYASGIRYEHTNQLTGCWS